MLLNGHEMSQTNYVVPTVVLQRLLEAAAAAHFNTVVRLFHVLDSPPTGVKTSPLLPIV